jgi:alpha-D-xyloside xylohydrolase
VDKSRYGTLKENIRHMHDMHVHTMVSVWPNMNPGGENHTQFNEAGYLLNDYSTYDAFNEKARNMYWEQASEELFDAGFDSWWCDSTEPFPSPDWGGAVMREPWERYRLVGEEHKKYIDAGKANEYALYHARGIYENQRKVDKERRVLNLTRSGYAGSQKYGTVLWSGDISANWKTLKKQIPEGLNMAMSGIANWTLDIGAFFVVGTAWWKRGCKNDTNPNPIWFWKGEYNDGVEDPGYRELYVRWFEYGCFLPMFRSHGTDTPREIWNFGKKGDPSYDAIEKYIRLRYRLMPYVYSLAGAAYQKNRTIMRSLIFDFSEDKKAVSLGNEYMYGPAFLICPVTEPMYYAAEGVKLDREKTWNCYLPAGTVWHEFWTGKNYEGGQDVTVDAPLDKMPIFVKAGSIVPMCEDAIEYADAVADKELELQVYDGADGEFTLYEDAGDGYGYENGEFTEIPLSWKEKERTLTLGQRKGSFAGMQQERSFVVVCGDKKVKISYTGEEVTVTL